MFSCVAMRAVGPGGNFGGNSMYLGYKMAPVDARWRLTQTEWLPALRP